MIKKLDKLILKAFWGPFIATFFIAFFILMMQNLWKYIDDLVGKGLDFVTLCKFLWYASASMLTLAMPIAILISSIMTFGNLGESFELVAIKSSGISLLRFMRPLMWVALLLCGITFLFANYVIPYGNLKFKALYRDIYFKKPAFDLKEGTFFKSIDGYAIKVGRKEPDGKTMHQVLIYEQNNGIQDIAISAEKGIMQITPDNNFLEFNLKNGYRYMERGNSTDTSTEYIRMGFKEFTKNFDLSILKMDTTNEDDLRNNYQMQNVRQLNKSIDSLKKSADTNRVRINRDLGLYAKFTLIADSNWTKASKTAAPKPVKNMEALIPDSIKGYIYDKAISNISGLRSQLTYSAMDMESRLKEIRLHRLEWHRKFALSMACLVLFFIGAPLGSIIRKGGMGMPLVVAILFFLIFHLLNVFGEKFVKEGIAQPYIGMWLAVIVLIPMGFFLTYKAMHDSQLFNKEFYNRLYKKIRPALATLANFFSRKQRVSSNFM